MGLPLDAYFTPSDLAEVVVSALPDDVCDVADFNAGEGALLRAVLRRFPNARVGATDVDPGKVRDLRRANPAWSVGCLDALSSRSRSASPVWRALVGVLDAVVLNPPFSYRGGRRAHVRVEGQVFQVSPAMAHMLVGLSALRPGGVLVGIMPRGSFSSQRDANAWRHVRSFCRVEQISEVPATAFQRAVASTRVVRLVRGAGMQAVEEQRPLADTDLIESSVASLVRGRVQVHRVDPAATTGAPFVHTTNLRAGGVSGPLRYANANLASCGPLIILPRIGFPSLEKVVLLESGHWVLSDCLFGIRPEGGLESDQLLDVVRGVLPAIRSAYGGSCAPYLTLDSLISVLAAAGVVAKHVHASSCACPKPD
jgi:predicted RNA methylase